MRPYRDVAALAGAQIACFLLLTHLEPNLFLIHFYEAILYIAILVMLFYMEDRWALLGIHDRNTGFDGMAGTRVYIGSIWRQRAAALRDKKCRCEYSTCSFGRVDYGIDRNTDDRFV
jgi:hypothetical protein